MKHSASKRLSIFTVIIFVAVIIGMVSIRDRGVDTDITANTTKVGLVLIGSKEDANYNQAHYGAMMNIKDELNLEVICREYVPEDEECFRVIKDLIEKDDCEFIIGPSLGYGQYLMQAARAYPGVCFVHPMGTEKSTNLSSCMGRIYQVRYLSGIVAGLRSESGRIGYVAAFENSEVVRGINAFTIGVKSVAPHARVFVRYCDSWESDELTKKGTEKLLKAHPEIDVLSMHTDSLEPNRIAEERGIYSIGYNLDNAEKYPNSYLTACELHWDAYYKKSILSYLQGKFHGDIEWLDMESGMVSLSALTPNVAEGTDEAVEKAKERFYNRSFDVFYGPIRDNVGTLRVLEGESMSDQMMLNSFDWYVEGVTVEE